MSNRSKTDPTTLVAAIIAFVLVWTVNSVAWWYAIPLAASVVGRHAEPAFWQCLLLSLIPGIGQSALAVLAVAWIASLLVQP